ncbi:MAG: hypothetical protein ACLSFZ_13260 [Frisingicoccus sp.]
MTLLLNEVKEAKRLLESGDTGSKPTAALFLLAKYYRHKEDLSKNETIEKLNDFMASCYKHYHPALWEDTIEDIAKSSQISPVKLNPSVSL